MANTVSLINLSDTFGVWINRTNDIVKENNDLAANNYTKGTGTLFLDDPSTGLQVKNKGIVQGGFEITGPGSYLKVDNNITSNGQVNFTNPNTGLTNSGELISKGKISANGTNIGLAVANNTTIGGYLTVANTLSVTRATNLGNTLSVSKSTTLSDILSVTGATSLGNILSVTENGSFGNNITVTNKTSTSDLFVTNNSNTRTLTVGTSGSVLLDLSIDRATFANTLQANTSVNTATLSVTGSSFLNILQANSSINTRILSVTGSSFVDTLQANTSINTASFVARTSSVNGSSFVNILHANNVVNTTIMTASDAITGKTLTANTSLTTPLINLSDSGKISANGADIFINNIVAQGRLSVVGDFVINGTTVYNSPAMTLSAQAPNQIGYINVFRTANGQSNGVVANASIRWNESANPVPYWDIKDTGTGTFYRIITEQQVLDTVNSTSSANAASSKAANTLNNSIISLNASLNSNVTSLQSQINSNVTSLQSQITSNASISQAGINASYARANNSSNSFTGTTGSVIPNNGSITFTSTNGVTISGTGSTLTVNTPQNLRTTDTVTFNNLILSSPLSVSYGGTGQTTTGGALTALLPGGTTAGYVLTTGGPGNFYWAQGSGGGGGGGSATPGTTIASSRLSYTATDGQKVFVSPPFTTGTQVRVYINGVRQTSDYTENSTPITGVTIIGTAGQFSCTSATLALNQAIVITGSFGGTGSINGYVTGKTYYIIATNGTTTFTLSESQGGTAVTTVAGTPTGVTYTTGYSITLTNGTYNNDAVLVEVDGFIINPYYANNIAFTVNSTIGATANTIQLAIDGLTSLAAPKADPEFSGIPKTPTATVGTNTTQIASTKFVNDSLNAGTGTTYTHSISGNSGTTSQTDFTSLTVASSTVITAANYNTYAPSKTGTGASGEWDISASKLGNYSPQTSPSTTKAVGVNEFPRSDVSGNMFLQKINSNTENNENPTVSQVIVTNGSDNYYRKSAINGTSGFGSQLTTLGTISTGIWQGTKIGVAYGGTGVTTLNAGLVYADGTTAFATATSAQIVAALGTTAVNNATNATNLSGGSVTATSISSSSNIVLNSVTPTVYFQDTDHRSAMLHCNSNTFYILRGSGTNSQAWAQPSGNANWPLEVNLENNDARFGGNITAVYNITAYSDIKLKENIKTIDNSLEKTLKLRGVYYNRKDDDAKIKKIGVIAQEIKEVLPEVVITNINSETGEETLSVDYGNIVGVLIEAVKELKAEIDDLKGKIK